jgi:hypothetical protein
VNCFDSAHDNGMQPTANSAAFMREAAAGQRYVAGGDAQRWIVVFLQRLEIAMRLLSKMVVIGVTLSALGMPIVTKGQERKEPMVIGEDVGVDGSYCESAKPTLI